jgi:hypothetical protein
VHKESIIAGLQKAVQRLVNGTSSRFVPQPTPSAVFEDVLIGITRFRNACRWKEFWLLRKPDGDASSVREEGSTSLGTGLRPVGVVSEAPPGSRQLEQFLEEVEFEILAMLKRGNEDYAPTPRSKAVNGLLANLQGQDQVVVPTDKTNLSV